MLDENNKSHLCNQYIEWDILYSLPIIKQRNIL